MFNKIKSNFFLLPSILSIGTIAVSLICGDSLLKADTGVVIHLKTGETSFISSEDIESIEFVDEGDTDADPINLSKDEMANCYIVQKTGKYKFEASNQFNLGEGLPVPPRISPVKAALVWQTAKGSIKNVALGLENGVPFVSFEVAESSGNALIAVYDENDVIQWSWHIWMPEEEISSVTTSSGYEVMNLNLGASVNSSESALSYGMLYQWGRKDPFPASETLTGNTSTVSAPMYDSDGNPVFITNSSWYDSKSNTIEFSIQNPTVCLSNYSQYSQTRDWLVQGSSDDSLWGNPEGNLKDSDNQYYNKGAKTCYDPSPAGWRVPPADVFSDFTTSGGYAWTFDDFNVADINKDGVIDLNDYQNGWFFNVNDETSLFFPAASRFDGSYAMLMGSMAGYWGNYWSNSPYSNDLNNGLGYAVLTFQVKDQMGNEMVTVSPSAGGSRADAFSIRCIRDTTK